MAAKAKALGVSRQTCYYWHNGVTRPNIKQARRLAKITGIAVEEIRKHVLPDA
jgi:DNA-binding XRE family transcriptional regulator